MKTKSFIPVALAMVAALSIVSCKCNSKKTQKPTQEEVQQQKQALADSVLADIDALTEQYIDASSKSFRLQVMQLTDEEKLLKPDYLLDPSVANNLVTRSQKINALAIYIVEAGIRRIYDMPIDNVKESIAKLAVDLNYPIDLDYSISNSPVSEKTKARYDAFKQRGDMVSFWQFEYALVCEIDYIVANNPNLFFNKITEEQWQSFYQRKLSRMKPIEDLAQYDEEMAQLYDYITRNRVLATQKERDLNNQTKESAKQFRIANKDKYIARRNALLQ